MFTHGDLLPRNILRHGDAYLFLDWEWASFRSPRYDDTTLRLFTGGPPPANLDAVAIALRELRLWRGADLPVRGLVISRWEGILWEILRKILHPCEKNS